MKAKYIVSYHMTLETGLHIGGSNDNFSIGGIDNGVIKNPLTNEPYIPGSSIKGKMRSLVEMAYAADELIKNNGEVTTKNQLITKLFGKAARQEKINSFEVTRLIFRDAILTEESKKKLESHLGFRTFTEVKAENSINRLSGVASNPRFTERVPAGAEFAGEIIITTYDGDDEEKFLQTVRNGLQLIEDHYLGGSGSRGYGRVKVNIQQIMERSKAYYTNNANEEDVTELYMEAT